MGEAKTTVRLSSPQFDDLKNSAHDIRELTSATLGQVRGQVVPKLKGVGEQLEAINETLRAGLAEVVKAIREKETPSPPAQQRLEVKFVFKVPNNQPDEPFAISIGGVTDTEGEPLPGTEGLTVAVESSDDAVVSATFDPSTNSGVAHFGTSGVAALTAKVSNAKGDILGSGVAGFTVTTSEPSAVSDVKIAFAGLTEEPEV